MMASVLICNRLQKGKAEKVKVDDILLTDEVSKFRSKVAEVLGVSGADFLLIYCGWPMEDDHSLDSYGVKPGVTVQVFAKPKSDEEIASKLDPSEVQQVVTAMQAAMLNAGFRNTVEQLSNDREALANMIVATPGLRRDCIAMAMLQNANMLAFLADPAQASKILDAHPALGGAAMLVAAAVNEEAAKGTASSSRATYSLDQMSDDEDMPSQRIGQMQPGGGASQMITASQLAAALATAGAPPPPTSQAAQLAQLRDMGITDERVAREALQATDGDIQAALELIFGDGNFS